MIANVLSIAGSDPSGGAGIQADLKTFSALGCYGMAVITSLTAQNTQGVHGVFELPPDFVAQQIEALFEDISISAVKIGMAGHPETIKKIAQLLQKYKPPHIVVDPVMVSQSGHRLISDEAIAAIKEALIPLASLVTPNLPEADFLGTCDPKKLLEHLNARAILLKGGHEEKETCTDIFVSTEKSFELAAPRIPTRNNHGTGCTLSSAITAYLAKGETLENAVRKAKIYITQALKTSDQLKVGRGHGPVHHFHGFFKDE